MLDKNSEHLIEITGTGTEGEGVGRVDGFAVFVPFALLGEKVKIKILKSQKTYAFGKLLEVIDPSKHRTEPKCKYFYKCGGCTFWHLDYEAELEYKTQKVTDCIKRIGGIDIEVMQTIGSQSCERYRNKAQFPVTPEGIGFFAQRSHRLISVDDCIIQNEINEEIIDTVREFMFEFAIRPFDEAEHTGDIRHIYTRVAEETGEIMVCIVTRAKKLRHSEELVERLCRISPNIVSIVQNINQEKTNVALGNTSILLFGKPFITDKLGQLQFEISPHSFYQVNHKQTKVMYDKVVEFAGLTKSDTVFDLYCGIGTISLYVAKYAKRVVGVECVEQSVLDARKNAELNGITNAEFYVGNAEEVAETLGSADVVIIDPPRKGCDEKLLKTIAKISPKRVVYVSCNPATLARDLKILTELGYVVKTIQTIDMFPRSPHVECVVLIERK